MANFKSLSVPNYEFFSETHDTPNFDHPSLMFFLIPLLSYIVAFYRELRTIFAKYLGQILNLCVFRILKYEFLNQRIYKGRFWSLEHPMPVLKIFKKMFQHPFVELHCLVSWRIKNNLLRIFMRNLRSLCFLDFKIWIFEGTFSHSAILITGTSDASFETLNWFKIFKWLPFFFYSQLKTNIWISKSCPTQLN